ncbi:MAG: choice-of-anchor D domain-containing protein [Thermodesulfobacteriota bacterium]|nr:choice-of-anchor D domain-containing protein [Thermodesulfobacteriota bacterium]
MDKGAGTRRKKIAPLGTLTFALALMVVLFGTSTAAVAVEIKVTGNGQEIDNGDETPSTADHTEFGEVSEASGSITRTFYIENAGGGTLSLSPSPYVDFTGGNPGDFTVTQQPLGSIGGGRSTYFDVKFDPTDAGERWTYITIDNNDDDEDPYHFIIQGTGLSSEGIDMGVKGNNVTIRDGDTSPSTEDHTDFGEAEVDGGTVVRTFTIKNYGADDLNLAGSPRVAVSGADASDFTVTAQPPSPVSGGGSETFQVTFNPSAQGLREATLGIANNDPDENPYNFAIQGTGAAPVIDVQGNGQSISNGDTSPSTADGTDFGATGVEAETVVHTFTIENTGSINLELTGTPKVAVGGTHAGDFVVNPHPGSPVYPQGDVHGNTTTFKVTFDPSEEGLRSARLSIANNDDDQDPYEFDIQGRGGYPEIDVQRAGTSIPDGGTDDIGNKSVAPVNLTYTIDNTAGTAPINIPTDGVTAANLSNCSNFQVDTTLPLQVAEGGTASLSISFDVDAHGLFSFDMDVDNNDGDEDPYDIHVSGVGTEVEMDVERPAGTPIADGGTDDLGPRRLDTVNLTYTVANTGQEDLTVDSPTTSGPLNNVSNFSVTSSPSSPVSGGGSTTFSIGFDIDGNGPFDFDMEIGNNDVNENPYNIKISGTGDSDPPGITSFARENPATSPTNADTLVFRATFDGDVQNVDAGDFRINGTTTATVTNVNPVDASTYDVTVSDGDLADFDGDVGLNLAAGQDIIDLAGNALPAGEPATDETYIVENDAPGITSFTRQNPATSPTNVDQLTFRAVFDEDVQNVDAGDFGVNGTTTATVTNVNPVNATTYDVTVSDGDLADFDGDVGLDLPAGQDITDLAGNALPAGEPGTDETYSLDNTAPTPDVDQAGGQADPASTLPINFSVDFGEDVTGFTDAGLTLGGTALGTKSAVVTGGPASYNVAVSGLTGDGTVTVSVDAGAAQDQAGNNSAASTAPDSQVTFDGDPEIDVQRPASTSIADNGTDDVGSPLVGRVSLTYTIDNTAGTDQLSVTNVTASGLSNVSNFSLDTATPINVAGGGTSSFDISFDVDAEGAFSLDMDIANNDSDEDPYDIHISGTGTSPEMDVSGLGTSIADGDATPSTADDTDFGNVAVAGGTNPNTFTIINTGTAELKLSVGTPRVTIGGPHGADFTLTTDATTPVASGGGTTTFTVTFDPGDIGLRTATVSIGNDDSDENPYDFAIQGTGAVLPTVTTGAVEDETSHSAIGNGTITDLGTPDPTAHGVVWNMTGGNDPTLADNSTDEGATTSTEPFTTNITDLRPNTTYAVRAYATNDAGTAYGEVVSFTTLPSGMPPVYYLLDEQDQEPPEPRR